jgi:predicted DNA-binding transcriptional regulator YafY
VQDGYEIDKNIDLEDEIILDIFKEFSSSMGSAISGKVNELFNKISNIHDNPIYSRLEIEDIYNKIDEIKDLQKAIENNFQVEFHHSGKYRYVEPVKITTFEGYWYLYGKDILASKYKTFYIKDIEKLTVTDKTFEDNPKAVTIIKNAINIWFNPNNEPFEVELLVDKDIAKYFKRRPLSNSQRILEELDDGSIHILLYATSKQEILTEVKKWLPNLYVLSPTSIAKELRDEVTSFQTRQMDLLI